MTGRIVTLTTDFGLSDGFVGTMKGVALGICPGLVIVDITHDVPPQDVRTGGLLLRAAHSYFPEGTVHVAVVDPGVGSRRRAILVQGVRYLFLGPDNGILTFAVEGEGAKVRDLCNPAWLLPERSATFHGRDVFAPAAAHLAAGADPADAGPEVFDAVRLPLPAPRIEAEAGGGVRVHGVVIHVDRFGNLMTNIDRASWDRALSVAGKEGARVYLGGREIGGLVRYYQESPEGRPAALFNAWGFVEVFVSSASAARTLRAGVDAPVVVELGG